MDIVSIIGLVIAVVALGVGMVLKGVSPSALNNPAAILIILAGTVGAVTIATPGEKLGKLPKLFGVIFKKSAYMTHEKAIKVIIDLSEAARKDGILALEPKLAELNDPFIKDAIQMLVDGAHSDEVADSLEETLAAMETRHAANAQVFTQAGTYAPTLGVLGAVLGLIAALGNLNDTEKLGHAIAAAFVATLLGIFTGYVLWHPFANRLKQKSKMEVSVKRLLIEGIIGLCEGKNPRMVESRMRAHLERTGKKAASSASAR
jgi:chemotaxis protein MotA